MTLLCFSIWAPASNSSEHREFWYGAATDHLKSDLTVRLIQMNGTSYVRQLDLKLLGIKPPEGDHTRIAGERFYESATLPEHRLIVDHLLRRAIFIRKQNPHLPAPPSEDLLLSITANGKPLSGPQYLRYQEGEILVPEGTMRTLGIEPRKVQQPVTEEHMPLHTLAGERFVVDYERLSLETRLLPQVLKTSRINVTEHRTASPPRTREPSRSEQLSAVLSYDLAAGTNSQDEKWHSTFYDLTIGKGNSLCQTEHLDTSENRWLRVNTHCQRDWPERRLTATVGDALGSGGPLTRPWSYSGLHIGTDFALQPNLVTIPSRSITGIIDQPATVEIWVDDALSFRQEIPAGPFEVNDIPLRTGAGEVRAFLTPAFGQRQYYAYDFYVDRSLLTPGLTDWSLEAGQLRTQPFSAESQYGEEFVSGHIRYGLHQRLTTGFAMQATESLAVANVSAAFVVEDWLAIDSSVAVSRHHEEVSDFSWRARISHQSQWINASYQIGHKPGNYQDLAQLTGLNSPNNTRHLSIGVPLVHGTTFNYNEMYQHYENGLELNLKAAGFSVRLGGFGSLRLSATRTGGDVRETAYGAHLTVPFGSSHNASFSTNTEGGRHWQSASVQKNLPSGPGYGYMADFSTGAPYQHGTLRFDAQGRAGRVSLRGDSFDGDLRGSARASGSLLVSASGLDLSRRTQGSYAVVDVGVANIPVYHGGQLKAYTDGNGSALIPGLRPFERNQITIRAEDVPLDVQPETLSTAVKPGRREVTKVNFAFKRERYFRGSLTSATKNVTVSPGASIYVDDTPVTVVGHDGAFFIAAKSNTVRFTVDTSHGRCAVDVIAEPSDQAIVTDLGTLICE